MHSCSWLNNMHLTGYKCQSEIGSRSVWFGTVLSQGSMFCLNQRTLHPVHKFPPRLTSGLSLVKPHSFSNLLSSLSNIVDRLRRVLHMRPAVGRGRTPWAAQQRRRCPPLRPGAPRRLRKLPGRLPGDEKGPNPDPPPRLSRGLRLRDLENLEGSVGLPRGLSRGLGEELHKRQARNQP